MRRIRNFFNNILGRLRGIPKFIAETDNLVLLLIGVGVGLALALVVFPVLLPAAAPFLQIGVECDNLAAPRGGNSRSMLSLEGGDFQNVEMKLELEDRTIVQGEELEVRVIFTNQDAGPVILFMPQNPDLVQGSAAVQGVRLEIRNIVSNQVLAYGIPAASIPQSTTFRSAEIHLLQSHHSCHQVYKLDTQLPAGEYSVIASYANTQAGVYSPRADQTRDPNFNTQGVWISDTRLNSVELRFTILPPPTATPPPVITP